MTWTESSATVVVENPKEKETCEVKGASLLRILGLTAAIIIMGVFGAAYWYRAVDKESNKGRKCMGKLRFLHDVMEEYAEENEGAFPSSLSVLIEEGLISPEVLKCPASATTMASIEIYPDHFSDYCIVPGLSPSSPAWGILLYERQPNHRLERYVCYVSGSVHSLDEAVFIQILKKQISGERTEDNAQ